MKKTFEMPEIEVVKFEAEAVLNTPESWPTGDDELGWEK